MSRLLASTVALAMAVGMATSASASAQDEQLPVTYNFLTDAVAAGYPFDADPPGTNIWSCKPTKAHPRPVILVHGTFGNKDTNWRTYGPLLKNNGYCVFSLTYGVPSDAAPVADQLGGQTNIKGSAKKLKAFVTKVRKATGAKRVDIVGHSQGTLMPNYYAKFLGGARYIHHYVSLAPLWHGTQSADAQTLAGSVFGTDEDTSPACTACGQMSSKSAFIATMRAGGVKAKGIRYTNIMTKYDELVQPYTSGREKGMRNFVVQDFCATDYAEHFEIASDPVASVIVLNALDPRHQRPVPCTVVLPFVGPLG